MLCSDPQQLSFISDTLKTLEISTFDQFYSFVSSVTAWAEDRSILNEVKINRRFNATLQANDDKSYESSTPDDLDDSVSSPCNMNVLLSADSASIFFFGKKAISLLYIQNSLHLELAHSFISFPVPWCPSAVKRKLAIRFSLKGVTDEKAFRDFLCGLKLQCFRMLTPQPIGCCNSYLQCSDQKQCIKPRWLSSVRCYYRENLENNRIFYGKNANIDCALQDDVDSISPAASSTAPVSVSFVPTSSCDIEGFFSCLQKAFVGDPEFLNALSMKVGRGERQCSIYLYDTIISNLIGYDNASMLLYVLDFHFKPESSLSFAPVMKTQYTNDGKPSVHLFRVDSSFNMDKFCFFLRTMYHKIQKERSDFNFADSGIHISISSDPAPTRSARQKGKSLLSFPGEYVAIDIETTGLDPEFDSIIELGAVRMVDGNETSRFSSLVNPECEIDSFITSLTGITNEMLSSAPVLPDILPAFLDFVGSSIVVGHNVHFDVNFIYDACEACELPRFANDSINTIRISRRLYPTLPNHKLSTVSNFLNIQNENEHRAASDALVTAMCLEEMRDYACKNAISFDSCQSTSKIKSSSLSRSTDSRNANSFDSCQSSGKVKASSLSRSTDSRYDPDNMLFEKVCVFTGALEKMSRRNAMQLVTDIGGICADNVSKKTNFLILGNNDYYASVNGGKSAKQRRAEALRQQGYDITILSENVFYDLVL